MAAVCNGYSVDETSPGIGARPSASTLSAFATSGGIFPGGRPTTLPPTIPDHALLCPIGAGNYGEVWLARSALGTLRAVKVVRRAAFDEDRPYEREFAGLQKFEPISRTHEGFVDLLQVGLNDAEGWFYSVMELADDAGSQKEEGTLQKETVSPSEVPISEGSPAPSDLESYTPLTLSALVKLRGAQPIDDCLRVARTLTSALVTLHGHGLVHRDIKPSNIIFVDDVPKLADVGLVAMAKGLGQERSYVGTEGFIPPEGPGTPSADIYSLGIVLYVLGAGRSHRHFPEPPEDLATRPDREGWLEFSAVIHRAAAADPRQRYASAQAMLDDLERLAAGKSVKRRWATRRLMRWVGLFVVVGGGVAAVVFWPARKANLPWGGFGWTTNQAASDAWTKGNSLGHNDSGKRAIQRQLFEQAIRLDPNFAYAHASLAGTLEGQACTDYQPLDLWPEAERHLRRASELEPDLAWNHLLRSGWLTLVQYDWRQAEAEIQLALKLEPTAHHRRNAYAGLLIWLGRFDEALKQIRMAIADDVSAGGFHDVAALAYYYDRQFTKALAELDQVDQLVAYNSWGQQTRAHTYMALKRTDEALAIYRRILQERPQFIYAHAFLFYAATVANQRLPSDPTLQYLLDHSSEPRGAYGVALAYTALGDKTKALDWLDKAYERREWDMREIKPDFRLDSLRTEPRFRELLKKMNLE